MLIYYILLLYLLILGLLFYRHPGARVKKLFLFLAFAGLFLLMAVRSESVGTDVRAYGRIFRRIAVTDSLLDVIRVIENAPVYCLLCKAVSFFGDYRLMLVVTALITMSSVAVYIYIFSDNVFLSTYCFVSLYFYLHSFNISRQFLALALILLAVCFRKKERVALCATFFILAVGIHPLAILSTPLLIFHPDHVTSKKYIILMGVATVLIPLSVIGFAWIVSIFSSVFGKYQMYLTGGIHSVYDQSQGAGVYLALFYILVVAMAIVIQKEMVKGVHLKQEDRSQIYYFIITVLVGGMMGMLMGKNLAITRILYFYQIHVICLIPNVFCKLRRERFYYLMYFGLLLILLIPFAICLVRNHDSVVPYVSMWA